RDQERPTLADRALGDQSQLGEIAVPTDKRQPLSQAALQAPEDDGRMDLKRLAARLLAYQRTELETASRRPDRSLAGDDRPGLGALLQAGGGAGRRPRRPAGGPRAGRPARAPPRPVAPPPRLARRAPRGRRPRA